MKNTEKALALGAALSILYDKSKPYFKNQTDFLETLFQSYYKSHTEHPDHVYAFCQSKGSQLLNGHVPFPPDAFRFYIGQSGNDHLRSDVNNFLAFVAETNSQRVIYYNVFLNSLQASQNLHPTDKNNILACTKTHPDNPSELLFQILWVLIREPFLKPRNPFVR